MDLFRMTHLPHRGQIVLRGRQVFVFGSRARRLIVNRSTTWRVTPTGTDVFTVFHYAWDCRIASGIREHFRSSRFVVLSVVIDERDTLLVVVLTRLLAVRTSRLGIND